MKAGIPGRSRVVGADDLHRIVQATHYTAFSRPVKVFVTRCRPIAYAGQACRYAYRSRIPFENDRVLCYYTSLSARRHPLRACASSGGMMENAVSGGSWYRNAPIQLVILSLILLGSLASPAFGTVLTSNTTWSGEVTVEKDVLVPEGVTLAIAPGTTIRVIPAESTKTDPEYLSPLTEITVRGRLVAEGTHKAPITFRVSGAQGSTWAGILVDGGKADLRSCTVQNAESGIEVNSGTLSLTACRLTGNRYGLVLHGPHAVARAERTRVEGNDYGIVLLAGAKITERRTVVRGNRKKDRHRAALTVQLPSLPEQPVASAPAGRVYKNEAILGMVIWQNRVQVQGVIRVPEGSRLVIFPGTVVEFTKRDTNGDGIGENGILVQGTILAKGTSEQPIIFRSAEKSRRRGDWDAINIMNSDRSQNLLEHCRIEDAYRGLHFHFANVAVADSVIRNNYRGIQFQESIVDIRRTYLYGNRSGLQARDSEVVFRENVLFGNHTAMNVFRNNISITGNTFIGNEQEGLRVREGVPVVTKNLIAGNRYGLLVSDGVYGTYAQNVISRNLESGVSIRKTNNIEISGNAIQGNGLFGVSLQDAGAVVRGNLISDNAERGIGVQSFEGEITENNILRNGLYNLGIDGPTDVSAPGNWWGGEDLARTIFDKEDDAANGRAAVRPVRAQPVDLPWPLASIRSDTTWYGAVSVPGSLSVEQGAALTIAPGTHIRFATGAGLSIQGKIVAEGTPKSLIVFSGMRGKGPEEWDEIHIDHAPGSRFEYCVFRNATWALHSHFTDLKIRRCLFETNYGGMRFTSGPLEVTRSLFRGNDIGIRAYRGIARFEENTITGNRIGIFVREKGGGLKITKNDLYANTDYNIRLGDFNNEDVNARHNWWGDDPPPSDLIYDAMREPGIGTVRFAPAAKKPYSWNVPSLPASGNVASEGSGRTGEVR